jgi:hypothetical protein
MAINPKILVKDLNSSPDEVLSFEEIVNLGDLAVARVMLEPGWSWEKHVKPRVKTNSCEIPYYS